MAKNDEKPTVGDEIARGLTGLRDALRDGERLCKRFTMRTVNLKLEPMEFTPGEIKDLRKAFKASQAVFALLIGVGPSTVQNWEQGRTSPPAWGRRLLELMRENPKSFEELLEQGSEYEKPEEMSAK